MWGMDVDIKVTQSKKKELKKKGRKGPGGEIDRTVLNFSFFVKSVEER